MTKKKWICYKTRKQSSNNQEQITLTPPKFYTITQTFSASFTDIILLLKEINIMYEESISAMYMGCEGNIF